MAEKPGLSRLHSKRTYVLTGYFGWLSAGSHSDVEVVCATLVVAVAMVSFWKKA